jgi:hypothetical protein
MLDSGLRSILDTHAPVQRRQVRPGKCAPWYADIRDELCQAKQQRRQAERQWRKSGLTVHKQIYSAVKRRVTAVVHGAKTRFYSSKIASSATSRQLFDVCGRLCGRSAGTPLPTVHSSSQLPDLFSDYFVRKVTDIRAELDQLVSQPTASDDVTPDCVFASFQPITESDLKLIIQKSKPTTCSLDPVPTPLLLENLDLILPTLTQIVNDSLLSGVFPFLFKTAIVKPLLKKPSLDQNNLKNYRPVSNLAFLSKVIEKVVLQQMFSYLNTHDLICHSQSAYRPHHSTETALLKITNDILLALDGGDVSVLTLLDLSAAFDTIDHIILIHRLQTMYGISGTALAWFDSYLSGRTQAVLVNDQTSKSVPLSFGVPQGSVLGPILFIMYTKPISALIQTHSVSGQSFADDTQLQDSCASDQIHATIQTMQSCISDVKSWMTNNKLKLNDDKTEALLIKKKNASLTCAIPTSIQVGAAHISFSSCARNLGFAISDDMSLDKHIATVCRSAYFEIRKISAIRRFLSVQAANTLVCAFVLSRLDYCNSLLAGCPLYLLNKLQKAQNSAARLVLKSRKWDHAKPLLCTLHWLPIAARIDYKLSTLCFSFFSESAPSYISDLLSIYTPSRQLRSSSDTRTLCIPRTKTKTLGQRSFSFCAPKQWNSLPYEIRHIQTAPAFKKALKTYLFKQYN